jgi:hypothetical protein
MSVSKRHVTTRELLGEYLTFTPRARETDLLQADMRVMNPTLMADAIHRRFLFSVFSHMISRLLEVRSAVA